MRNFWKRFSGRGRLEHSQALGKFEPKGVRSYGLKYTRPENVAALNEARTTFNTHFSKIDVESDTLTGVTVFFEEAKKTHDLLKKAQDEIAIQKKFQEEKRDLAKDLTLEQPEDIAFTLVLGGVNFSIERKKIARGDFQGVLNDLKTQLKNAAVAQALTVSGFDPAFVCVYDAIVQVKNIQSFEQFAQLLISVATSAGTAIKDVVGILKVSAKSVFYNDIPLEVLEAQENYIALYQDENNDKLFIVVEKILAQLQKVSDEGVFPESDSARKKMVDFIETVRSHLSELEQRCSDLEKKIEASKKDDEKTALSKTLEKLQKQKEAIEEKCNGLHFWRSVHHRVLSDVISKVISHGPFVIETMLGVDAHAWVEARLRSVGETIDLYRALASNPDIAMASRTYKILKEHPVKSSPVKEAEFLIRLEAQQRRGLKAMQAISGSLKYVSQNKDHIHSLLRANQLMLDYRKIAVAEKLLLNTSVVDLEKDDAFCDFYEKITGIAVPTAREAVMRACLYLFQLKSTTLGNVDVDIEAAEAEKSLRHNQKIDAHISVLVEKYNKSHPEACIEISEILTESVALLDDETLLSYASRNSLKPIVIAVMVNRLLKGGVSVTDGCQQFIQVVDDYLSTMDDKAEKKKLSEKMQHIHRLYREDPKAVMSLTPEKASSLGKIAIQSVQASITQSSAADIDAAIYFSENLGSYAGVHALKKIVKASAEKKLSETGEALIRSSEDAWHLMCTILGERQARLNGFPDEVSVLNTQLGIIYDRASIAKKAVMAREDILKKALAEKAHWKKHSGLRLQSAYLAALTPYALQKVADRLTDVENFFTSDLLIRAERAVLNHSENEKIFSDIAQIRRDIAWSMYDRLMLTHEDKTADLVGVYAGIPSTAIYTLSTVEITEYREFIDKYGDDVLKNRTQSLLGSAANLLSQQTGSFEAAFFHYLDVEDTVDTEVCYQAALSLMEKSPYHVLGTAIPSDEAAKETIILAGVHQKYPDAKNTDPFVIDEHKKKIAEFLMTEKGLAMVASSKKEMSVSVIKKEFSSVGIVSNKAWQEDLKKRKEAIKNKGAVIRAYDDEVKKLAKAVETSKKSLANYRASFFTKPFRWIFGGGESARENKVVQAQLACEKLSYKQAKERGSFEAEAQKFAVYHSRIVDRVVGCVQADIQNGIVTAEHFSKINDFVVEYGDDNHQKQFKKAWNFTKVFLSSIRRAEPTEKLEKLVKNIGIAQPGLHAAAKRVLSFLEGNLFSYEAEVLDASKSLLNAIQDDLMLLLSGSGASKDTVDYLAPATLDAIKSSYLPDLVIEKLLHSEGTRDSKLTYIKKWVSCLNPEEKKALLDRCILVVPLDRIPATQSVQALFYCLPVFSEANDYAEKRDAMFSRYFQKHFEKVNAQRNYVTLDNDVDLLQLTRKAALPSEAGLPTVAQKILMRLAKGMPFFSQAHVATQQEIFSVMGLMENGLADIVDIKSQDADKLFAKSVVDHTRITVLKKLCDLSLSRDKAYQAFAQFEQQLKGGYPIAQTQGLKDLIEGFIHEPSASWMKEYVVRTLGTQEQLQYMHWSCLNAELSELNYQDSDASSREVSTIQEIFSTYDVDNQSGQARLTGFVGEAFADRIKEKLKALVLASLLEVLPPTLSGDVNKLQVASESVKEAVRRATSPIVQELLRVFEKELALFLISEIQHKVMLATKAKEYHGVASTVVSSRSLALSEFQEEILGPSLVSGDSIASIDEGSLGGADSDSNAESDDLGFSFCGEEDCVITDDDAAIEYPAPQQAYQYSENPLIYYTHYLLPVQGRCYRLLSDDAAILNMIDQPIDKKEKQFFKRFLKKDQAPVSRDVYYELTEFYEEMVRPLTSIDEKSIQPIIERLRDSQGIDTLKAALLRLSKHYTKADEAIALHFCHQPWLREEDRKLIQYYIFAVKNAAVLKKLIPASKTLVWAESIIHAVENGHFENLNGFLQIEHALSAIEKLPTLHDRIQKKIDHMLERVATFPAYVLLKVAGLVRAVGSDIQKEQLATLILNHYCEAALFKIPVVLEGCTLDELQAVVASLHGSSGEAFATCYEAEKLVSQALIQPNFLSAVQDAFVEEAFLKELLLRQATAKDMPDMIFKNLLAYGVNSGDVSFLQQLCEVLQPRIPGILASQDVALKTAAMPLLLMRAKALFSDKGAQEERDRVLRLTPSVSAASAMTGRAGMSLSALGVRQETPNDKQLKAMLTLVVSMGSIADKTELYHFIAHQERSSKNKGYLQHVLSVCKDILASLRASIPTVASPLVIASLFGSLDKDKVEWEKLKNKYASIAGEGWLSDTGKMFRKNRPYLEVVQEMIDKVLARSASKNKGTASFETLKALKAEGYFDCELKGKLRNFDDIEAKFEAFRDITPAPRCVA